MLRVKPRRAAQSSADVPGRRSTEGLAGRCLTFAGVLICGGLAACSNSTTRTSSNSGYGTSGPDPRWGVSASPRLATHDGPMAKGGGSYKVGKPYLVGGQWYTPREQPGYDSRGIASWYGDDFHGRKTSNGEIYDMNALTAAHPTLPMPSYAYVTNLDNGRTILLRINDRGPYVANRVIDLSRASARALGSEGRGLGNVRVRYAGGAPLNGHDGRERQFLASQRWSRYAPAYVSAAPQAPYRAQPAPPQPAAAVNDAWSPLRFRSGVGASNR